MERGASHSFSSKRSYFHFDSFLPSSALCSCKRLLSHPAQENICWQTPLVLLPCCPESYQPAVEADGKFSVHVANRTFFSGRIQPELCQPWSLSQRLLAACSAMLSWGIDVGWLPVSSLMVLLLLFCNNCLQQLQAWISNWRKKKKKTLASFNADFKTEMDWAVKLHLCLRSHLTVSPQRT